MVRAWRVHGPFDFYVSSARHTCSTPTLGRAHRPSYTSPPALPGPGIVRIMDLLGNETACKWAAPVIGASSHTPRRRAEPVGPARRVPRAPPVASHTPCPSRPTCPARHVSRVPPVASCAPHRRVPRAPPLRPTRPARRIPHALPVASRGSRPSRPARPAIASHAPRRRVPRAPPSRLAHHVPDPQRRASTTPHASGPTQTRVWPHHTSGRPSDAPTIAMGSHDGCKTNIDLGDIISNLSASYPGQHTLITHLATFLSTTAPPFIHIHTPFAPRRTTALVGATLRATHTQYAHLHGVAQRLVFDRILVGLAGWKAKWDEGVGCVPFGGLRYNTDLGAFVEGARGEGCC